MGDLNHVYYMGTDSNSTQKSKDWALKEKYIIFIFVAQHIDAKKTTELSSGTSAQERAWLEVKVFKLPWGRIQSSIFFPRIY